MAFSIFSFISEARLDEVLGNLHDFTELTVQLISGEGILIKTYGEMPKYCSMLQGNAFDLSVCRRLQAKAGMRSKSLGESYIFACHAGLNSIAFPLVNVGEILGSVIIGPFLMEAGDSSIISEMADRYHLSTSFSLDLFEELDNVRILSPAKVNQLKKLIDHLLSGLLPSERAILLQTQQKMSQQARINETIQVYKEQESDQSLSYFNKKEKDLLAKVRSGTTNEVKALLNDLMGHALFSEGSNLENIRVRSIELTTLLSRVAIDCGARTENIYRLNTQFIAQLYHEETLEDICMQMQDVLESFMSAMFSETDKGNPYIRKALRFMNDNYSEHLELAQVADYVELSPSYFSSLFHQVVGTSFRDHLNRIRVEESKRLLLSKKYSLADIAVTMGFPDQSYYCKVFKKVVGVTPGKYRG